MTEYQLTCQVAEMLKAAGLLFTHVPSECPDKKRSIMQARMGVAAGVPDFLVFHTPPLAIELKAKKGRLSDEQLAWLAQLETVGWKVAVCRSKAEVTAALEDAYGTMLYSLNPLINRENHDSHTLQG